MHISNNIRQFKRRLTLGRLHYIDVLFILISFGCSICHWVDYKAVKIVMKQWNYIGSMTVSIQAIIIWFLLWMFCFPPLQMFTLMDSVPVSTSSSNTNLIFGQLELLKCSRKNNPDFLHSNRNGYKICFLVWLGNGSYPVYCCIRENVILLCIAISTEVSSYIQYITRQSVDYSFYWVKEAGKSFSYIYVLKILWNEVAHVSY